MCGKCHMLAAVSRCVFEIFRRRKSFYGLQNVCTSRCLDLLSGLPGDAEHMFRNGPCVMGCLESKYLNTLRIGRPQLEPIKRCQLRFRFRASTFTDSSLLPFLFSSHQQCPSHTGAPCCLSSGTRLLVPGTWTRSFICHSQKNAMAFSVAPVLKRLSAKWPLFYQEV